MRPLDVEEGLDFVQAEIKRFNARFDTGDFHMLSCGPSPQNIGEGGGPIGVIMWGSEEERFEDCKKLIRPLLEAVEEIELVVDVEVEQAMGDDGEIWYIEFAKECDLPDRPEPSKKYPWEQ